MALIHNVFIRILNCIYLQAPNICPSNSKDVSDFAIFMHAWCVTIHEHHGNEEKYFFPWLEKAIGREGFMEKNVEQHHAFNLGLDKFESYVQALREKKEEFDGKKVISLIDGFGTTLTDHLKDEIMTLEALEEFEEVIDWKAWNQMLQDIALKTADVVSLFEIDLWYDLSLMHHEELRDSSRDDELRCPIRNTVSSGCLAYHSMVCELGVSMGLYS